MTVKAVIFDLDGTLVDSNEAHAIAWVNAYRLAGYGEVSIEEVRKNIGARGDLITERVLGKEAVKDYRRIRSFKDRVFLHLLREGKVVVFPEVYYILKTLRRYGIKLSVATSTSIPLLIIMLEFFNIINYFDSLVAGEEVVRSKPDPHLYLKALRLTGTSPQETLIVGDTEFDVIPAKNIGATSVYIKRPGNVGPLNVKPDYIVKDLTELAKIILQRW